MRGRFRCRHQTRSREEDVQREGSDGLDGCEGGLYTFLQLDELVGRVRNLTGERDWPMRRYHGRNSIFSSKKVYPLPILASSIGMKRDRPTNTQAAVRGHSY